MLVVTPIYAAALTVMLIALSVNVIAYRRKNRVALGDAGNKALQGRIRAQANFVEYVPMALLLMLMAELGGTRPIWLHAVGLCLLVGRVVHAYHLTYAPLKYTLRPVAVLLTFAALAAAAVLALPL